MGQLKINFKERTQTNQTKQLQDQGKKINASLSEMAQFFMKMAAAIKKKKKWAKYSRLQ